MMDLTPVKTCLDPTPMHFNPNLIFTSLQHTDPNDTAALAAIYQRYQGEKQFLDALIECLQDEQTCSGAGWLIKHAVEAGSVLDEAQSARLLQGLVVLKRWQAQLPLLQIIQHVSIAEEDADRLFDSLHCWLSSENTFVRAWSFHGLAVLADRLITRRAEVVEWIEMAMRDEKASVKARLRNLKKTYDWLA